MARGAPQHKGAEQSLLYTSLYTSATTHSGVLSGVPKLPNEVTLHALWLLPSMLSLRSPGPHDPQFDGDVTTHHIRLWHASWIINRNLNLEGNHGL
jgi:hypothetical protein